MIAEAPRPALERLADGTVRQINPFTGAEVWTVPGRGGRPLVSEPEPHRRLVPGERRRYCAFCEGRYLDTTPEKARLVRGPDGGYLPVTGLRAEELTDTVAEFRLIPNLFEIVSFDYWRLNHGLTPSEEAAAQQELYLSTPLGREHVERLLRIRAAAAGAPDNVALSDEAFFAGMHDVIVARRHFVDGALCEDELAGAGTLSIEEHRAYVAFTVSAIQRLYAASPLVRYVTAFQNWRPAAGASFDHLHKQVVALDTLGRNTRREAELLEADPDLFERGGIALAREYDLVVAENEHAAAIAGIGHRYPSVEVWSKEVSALPWELSGEQLDAFADLLHAMHVATGVEVASNEEWHHRPPSVPGRAPLRIVLKWRINTAAGFEGGTGIYVNTIDPWQVRDRVRGVLTGVGARR